MQIDMRDKIMGGVFGLCVADALGVPVEFNSRESLMQNPVTDMRGYGTYNQPPGTWSDDSSMVFCFMESFIEKGHLSFVDTLEKYVLWMNEGKYTPHGEVFDIGNTTQRALLNYIEHREDYIMGYGEWFGEVGGDSEYDNGNGALMRILPLAFLLHSKQIARELAGHLYRGNITRIIHRFSALTHATWRNYIACDVYVFIAIRLITGDAIKDAIYSTLDDLLKYYDKFYGYDKARYTEELKLYERIFSNDFCNLPQEVIKSSGYVVDTLEAALWCLLNTDTYESCVLKAVNLGGDTDTVAAVAGGLAGIYYGYESIPDKWVSRIARIDYIKQLCLDFDSSILKFDISTITIGVE